MRPLLIFLLLGCATGSAGIITDPFASSQAGGCNYSFVAPFSSCDVIGESMRYDIQNASVEIGGGWGAVVIHLNYGGGIALKPFDDGIRLSIGDLFFYTPGDPAHFLYAVPLTAHDGFQADALYKLSGEVFGRTADDLIHNSGYYYRRTQVVWLGGAGSPETVGLPVKVAGYGDGVHNALYEVSLEFPTTPDFLATVLRNHEVGISFSAAYCGNDVIQGVVAAAPEPSMALLMATGAGLLAGLVWLRSKRAPRLLPVAAAGKHADFHRGHDRLPGRANFEVDEIRRALRR
jgi:hypothetical protein